MTKSVADVSITNEIIAHMTYSMNWTKHCIAHLTQTIWYIVNVCMFYPIVLLKSYQQYTPLFAQQNLILCNMYGVRVFASYNILLQTIQSPLSSKLSTNHSLRWETLLSNYSSWSCGWLGRCLCHHLGPCWSERMQALIKETFLGVQEPSPLSTLSFSLRQ